MKITDRLKAAAMAIIGDVEAKQAPVVEAKAAPRYRLEGTNRTPLWSSTKYASVAQQGYKSNVHILAAINKIIATFTEAPLKVWKDGGAMDGQALDMHPISEVMNRPNEFMSGPALWAKTLLHLYLSGNAFWEIVRGENSGRLAEIWPLRPDYMKIVPDDDLFIAGYIYEIGGEKFPLETRDVIHFKFQDPLNEYFGMSPLMSAFRSIDIDNNMLDYQKTVLENGGIPAFAAFVDHIEDDAHLERMREQFKKRYGGKRPETVGFFDRIRDLKPIGMSFNDLAFRDLDSVNSVKVFEALGVPPIIAGALVGLEHATYSNAEQFRVILWEDVIEPLQDSLGKELEHGLKAYLMSGERLAFDPSNVSALRTLHQQERTDSRNEWESGLITQNEFRRRSNLPPVPGGDVFKSSFATVFIPETPSPNEQPEATREEITDEASKDEGEGAPGEPAAKSVSIITRRRSERKRLTRSGNHVTIDGQAPNMTAKAIGVLDYKPCGCGGHGNPWSIKAATDGLGLLAGPLGRMSAAQKMADEWKKWATAENAYQIKHVQSMLKRIDARKDLSQAEIDEVQMAMFDFQDHAQQGALPIIGKATSEAALLAGAEIGADMAYFMENEQSLAFIRGYSFKFADKYAETSRKGIMDIIARAQTESLTNAQLNKALDEMLSNWQAYRVDAIARSETIRASNAGTEEAWKQAQVREKAWLASDDACDYCKAMDGVVVSVGEPFFEFGDQFTPPSDGEKELAPMKMNYEDVSYPPLHPQCECTIVPVV